jgi:hypothetical protein
MYYPSALRHVIRVAMVLLPFILITTTLILPTITPHARSAALEAPLRTEPAALPADSTLTEADVFPLGVYDKYAGYDGNRFTDENWPAYYERVFTLLQDHNLNTIVSPYLCDVDDLLAFVELADLYDINVVLRVNPQGGCIYRPDEDHPAHAVYSHPAVVAFMYGDEPETEDIPTYQRNYEYMAQYYPDTPVVSAIVGESVTPEGGMPVAIWEAIEPQVRMIRFYPYRFNRYNLVDWWDDPEGFGTSPTEAFRIVEQANGGTPWWYVAQTFGQPAQGAGINYPTAPEVSALLHTALANGARGLLGFSLQPEQSSTFWRAMVTQDLEPESDILEQYGELAQQFQQAGALLLRHERASFDVDTDCPACLAVGRSDPETGTEYIYLVNQDGAASQTARLSTAHTDVVALRDVYTGREYTVQTSLTEQPVEITLEPGEGQFLEMISSTAPPATATSEPGAPTATPLPTNTPTPSSTPIADIPTPSATAPATPTPTAQTGTIQVNFPNGAPGSLFVFTVPDLPANATVTVAIKYPGVQTFTRYLKLTTSGNMPLAFAILTPRDAPGGGYTLRITVEPEGQTLAETMLHETTIVLDSTAPLRTEQPATDVPTVEIAPSDVHTLYLPFIQR